MSVAIYLELDTNTPFAADDPRLRQIGFRFDYITDPCAASLDPDMLRWRWLRWRVVFHRHTRTNHETGERETINTFAYVVESKRVLTDEEAQSWAAWAEDGVGITREG